MTRRTCISSGCVNAPVARDLCTRHFQRRYSFAQVLADAMTERSMRPTDLCRLTGLDRKAIWNYLYAAVKPQPRSAHLLAAALQCDDLLIVANVPTDPPIVGVERVASQLLEEHKKAVAEFCRQCEPVDFICRDNTCPLRAVSPLEFIPLARRRHAA